jgi:hypothetical protein
LHQASAEEVVKKGTQRYKNDGRSKEKKIPQITKITTPLCSMLSKQKHTHHQ